MTRQKNNQKTENFSQNEAAELGAFTDDALSEAEALEAQESPDNSEASNE